MSHADYYHGDSRATMRNWANQGGIPTPWGPQPAHLVLTSPPFLALRSYLSDDDPAKGLEMGSEPTPAAFLDALLAWTAAAADLLSPEGSLCVELGDTYAGSGGGGGDYLEGGLREGQPGFGGSAERQREGNAAHWRAKNQDPDGWPLAKCKSLIPELYRVALAYGINPLTGTESPAGRWRVRNVVTWARPNPPVGALGDKYRPATSDLVVACRSADRWFDLDAVRTPVKHPDAQASHRTGKQPGRLGDYNGTDSAGSPPLDWWDSVTLALQHHLDHGGDPDPLDMSRALRDAGILEWGDAWEIPTQPYPGSHYATWPARLCETPIRSMCPAEVSVSTGQGRRRITGDAQYVGRNGSEAVRHFDSQRVGDGMNAWHSEGDRTAHRVTETIGWSDTDPDGDYRPGICLDPFAGSGTTLAVATGHGRYAIGIDLDPRNIDLAADRVGPLLLTAHEGVTA